MERARAKNKQQRVAELEAELFPPPPPAPLIYLLEVYHRLRRRKASAGFGVAPVEWPDIDAFCRHAQLHLTPWELEIIEALDDRYLMEMNRRPADGPASKER